MLRILEEAGVLPPPLPLPLPAGGIGVDSRSLSAASFYEITSSQKEVIATYSLSPLSIALKTVEG